MKFNPETATVVARKFKKSRHTLWVDADGNIQLCCLSKHPRGGVLIDQKTIDGLLAFECANGKTVRFANPVGELDVTVEPSLLMNLKSIYDYKYCPHYVIGVDTFENCLEYPPPCRPG